MAQLTFDRENSQLIQAVENSFGASGKPLSKPGRVLMGQGRLMKQGRRKPQNKAFFLFNDVLVYGSILVNGHWHSNQKIIPLEDIELEDMEDGVVMKNQWLLRTPKKSFFVSALTYDEKQAWMEHIRDCKSRLLQASNCQAGSTFAPSWIPDPAAFRCMRCLKKFTATNRRHHCRKCGFLVCSACSKQRVVIDHIHPTKKLRVCRLCHSTNKDGGNKPDRNSYEDEDGAVSSDEEDGEVMMWGDAQSSWMDSWPGTSWGEDSTMDIYDYPRPMHLRP